MFENYIEKSYWHLDNPNKILCSTGLQKSISSGFKFRKLNRYH